MKDLIRQLEEDRERSTASASSPRMACSAWKGTSLRWTGSWTIAKTYGAILFVDDSHAVGVCGKTGRGTPEAKGVHGKVDVLTGTLGKAIGGAAGGYISGKKELIAFMRQKARTYIFSNSLPPAIVFGAAAAFDLLTKDRSHCQTAA